MLLIGTKLLMETEADEEAENVISSLNLSEFNSNNELQKVFVSKTLLNFDPILKISLIDVWRYNVEKNKQASAAQNLKFATKSREINEATKATASAIVKATEQFSKTESTNLQNNVRISNLERLVRKNESKSNEIFKKIKSNHKKNALGSYPSEPMASPQQMALSKYNTKRKQKLVDLMLEDDSEENTMLEIKRQSANSQISKNIRSQKRTWHQSPPNKNPYNGEKGNQKL
jgi:hypothetical protein